MAVYWATKVTFYAGSFIKMHLKNEFLYQDCESIKRGWIQNPNG